MHKWHAWDRFDRVQNPSIVLIVAPYVNEFFLVFLGKAGMVVQIAKHGQGLILWRLATFGIGLFQIHAARIITYAGGPIRKYSDNTDIFCQDMECIYHIAVVIDGWVYSLVIPTTTIFQRA